jgi:hypothetical protein
MDSLNLWNSGSTVLGYAVVTSKIPAVAEGKSLLYVCFNGLNGGEC